MGEVVCLCGRVGDMHNEYTVVEGSTKHPCNRCAHDVWVSQSSWKVVRQHRAEIVCLQCGENEIAESEGFVTTKDQVDEIRRHREKQ